MIKELSTEMIKLMDEGYEVKITLPSKYSNEVELVIYQPLVIDLK